MHISDIAKENEHRLHFKYHYPHGSVYQRNIITRVHPKKKLTLAFSFIINIFKFIQQNLYII